MHICPRSEYKIHVQDADARYKYKIDSRYTHHIYKIQIPDIILYLLVPHTGARSPTGPAL